MTELLRSDVTGWGLAGSLIVAFVVALGSERLVLRKTHNRLIEAEATKTAAEAAKTAAEVTKTDFYREAHKIERERNDVLMGGVVTIVTEIRRAVGDPKREPSL